MSKQRPAVESAEAVAILAVLVNAFTRRLGLLSEDLIRRPSSARARRDMLGCLRELQRLLEKRGQDLGSATVVDIRRLLRLKAITAALRIGPSDARPPGAA